MDTWVTMQATPRHKSVVCEGCGKTPDQSPGRGWKRNGTDPTNWRHFCPVCADRLEEIRGRLKRVAPGPWWWKRCYEIDSYSGRTVHWALVDPESALENKVTSGLLVLLHHQEEWLSQPVVEDPYLQFIAHAREDVEWLLEQLEAAMRLQAI